MSAETGKKFRSSISGYNKDDVNRYILDMDRKNKENTDKLTSDLETMSKSNQALAEKNEALQKQYDEAAARLCALEEELSCLKEEKNTLNENLQDAEKHCELYKKQAEAQNEVLERNKEEKNALNEKIRILTEEGGNKDAQLKANAEKYAADIETLRGAYETEIKKIKDEAKADDGVEYKLNMYDKISSQIGDILINANRNSDEIITAAKNEAEKLLTETTEQSKENSRRMSDRIRSCADETLASLKNDFSSNISSCISEILTCIEDMQYETSSLMSSLEKKQEEITERLDFYHNSISESIDSKINSMNSECTCIIHEESAAK